MALEKKEQAPQILFANVMHRRLIPKVNGFSYKIYYLSFPLTAISGVKALLRRATWGFLGFKEDDHGARAQKQNLENWAQDILKAHNIHDIAEITLICMPRVIGYVFNPVSFWLCRAQNGVLKVVLCEVHNTFGQEHTYLCAMPDDSPIGPQNILTGPKVFHVSPFLKREGRYDFKFNIHDDRFAVWIDYYNQNDELQLVTSLIGRLEPMTENNLRRAFFTYPLVTLKATALIHWQALKLIFKGIKYIPKPLQKSEKQSAARQLTNLKKL